MSKNRRYILIGIGVFFAVIQFVGPAKPSVSEDNSGDLLQNSTISPEISGTLKTACYDCHSMETKYPWYASIAPVSWFIFNHIDHGREELNFSNWASLDKRSRLRILKDIQEEVEEKNMPMNSYIKMHEEADLTDEQREALISWAKAFATDVLKE